MNYSVKVHRSALRETIEYNGVILEITRENRRDAYRILVDAWCKLHGFSDEKLPRKKRRRRRKKKVDE